MAKEHHPRFKPDMLIRTRVVTGATPADLIVRAVSDNETRKALGSIERILAVKKLDDAEVPVQRAAAALGFGLKTYERLRLIARHGWMFDLVRMDCVAPTTASLLLAVAGTEKRLPEQEADVTAWVADTRGRIAQKQRLKLLKDGKDLASTEQMVKTYLTRPLVEKWVKQLRAKERLAAEVPWHFEAGIDADSNKLAIASITVDLAKDPLDHLAKDSGKLERMKTGVLEYLKRRHAVEAPQGPQEMARSQADAPYDVEVLREAGLNDLADERELELMAESEPAQAVQSQTFRGSAPNGS